VANKVPLLLLAAALAAGAASPAADTSAERDGCPVTTPNRRDIGRVLPTGTHHGNGKLSTILYYPRLRVTARNLQPDGSVVEKFPWWRAVRGPLRIGGRRLDAPAPPLRALVPDGYGDRGFQATAIVFPTQGCWRVTGRVGRASLTFVLLVGRPA
jgi:hypothetical protein